MSSNQHLHFIVYTLDCFYLLLDQKYPDSCFVELVFAPTGPELSNGKIVVSHPDFHEQYVISMDSTKNVRKRN